MLLSVNSVNSSHLSWPSNQINKNAEAVELSAFFQTHLGMLLTYLVCISIT